MKKTLNFSIKFFFVSLFFLLFINAQGRYSESKNNYVGSSALKWINPVRGIPENAVIGDMKNGKPVFISRAYYKGRYYPGRTNENGNACIIGYKGKQVRVIDYQVLVFLQGEGEYVSISDDVNRKLLSLIYDISDELKKDKYSIFLGKDSLEIVKGKFVKMRNMAVKKQDKILARKIDKILDGLEGTFVKIDELKIKVEKLEDMF